MDNPKKDRSIISKHTPSLKPSNAGFKGMLVKDKETDVSLYYTVDCNVKSGYNFNSSCGRCWFNRYENESNESVILSD